MTARNSDALFRRLHAAALRAVSANNVSPVGRDGRCRVDLETVVAEGDLAQLLREIGGEIPIHEDACAARGRWPAECNCSVRQKIAEIVEGAP